MTDQRSGILAGFDSVPLYAGSLIGFRSWYVYAFNVTERRLLSAQFENWWERGVNVAECHLPMRGCDIADGRVSDSCGHGLWAYSSARDYLEWARESTGICVATGVVEGFGSTVVGPLGFRSMKARILAIGPVCYRDVIEVGLLDEFHLEVRQALGDYYRVPTYDTNEEMLADFPLTDTREFL